MKFLHIKSVVLFSLVLFVNSFSQNYQYFSPYQVDGAIEGKVEEILTKRDVGEWADELARNKSSLSAEDLLIRLSVFSRAGYSVRVRETLQIVSENQTLFADKVELRNVVNRAIDRKDLISLKIYYDELFVGETEGIRNYITIWKQKSDGKEVESWLKMRSTKDDFWWDIWIEFKTWTGEIDQITAELAEKIRKNPSDRESLGRYLRIVSDKVPSQNGNGSWVYKTDISWLEEVLNPKTAYESYELGEIVSKRLPEFAATLFKKSLALPFTKRDLEIFGERAFRGVQIYPNVTEPEKQLRYWTKRQLVRIYVDGNQGNLAQPIAEELVAMDKSGIQTSDTFSTAGATQAASGQRVIESKILQDEATKENSPQYWLERADYYRGRNEPNLVWDTLVLALAKFPYKPTNPKAMFPRLRFVSELSRFGDEYGQSKDVEDSEKGESETSKILRKELVAAKVANDFAYVYQLVNIIHDDYQDLRDEFFTNTSLFAKSIATKDEWNSYDSNKIEIAMESEKWETEKRTKLVNQLVTLARQNIRKRGFALAKVFSETEPQLAISLLNECLKTIPDRASEFDSFLYFDRYDILEQLLALYSSVGDWKSAEMIYRKDIQYLKQNLARIAQVAAENGAVADAVRIWKIKANFDRRDLQLLEIVGKTNAKLPLREFYLKLKSNDQVKEIPEAALKILQ